jgi:hypothetical protein
MEAKELFYLVKIEPLCRRHLPLGRSLRATLLGG